MRGFTLFAALALALSACGTSTSDDGTTTTGDGSATTSAAADTTTTTRATTTTTGATTTTLGASGGEDCLVGEWELDSEAFVEQMTSAMAGEGGAEDVTVEFVGGSYVVSMTDDGTFVSERDEWSFQAVMSEGTFRMTVDGTDTGTWSSDGDTVTVATTETNSTVSVQAEVDGELIDIPQGSVPLTNTSAVGDSATFSCSGDTLTVDSEEGFVSRMNRVGG